MRWPLLLTIFATACAASPPAIPEGERAACANGRECRSVTVGQTVIRGQGGQKLFTELVTADPSAFRNQETFDAALQSAGVDSWTATSPYSPTQLELCPAEPGGSVIEARHARLLKGPDPGPFAVCSADYDARYVISFRQDGSVACIENRFAYSCV